MSSLKTRYHPLQYFITGTVTHTFHANLQLSLNIFHAFRNLSNITKSSGFHRKSAFTVTSKTNPGFPKGSKSEVALKVHLSDASTHQPLSDATVDVFVNYTPIARETSGIDGNIFIRLPYRLGDLLVITATKRGYVPNSAPWRPTRLPVFSSLSLDLLPERAATLMVYDDEIQIVSGYQGSRLQPWIQFQRRALSLPPNATYTNLTAFLTVTHSGQNTQHFPYLQGLGSNSTASDRRFELTPVAAISVHLLGSDGAELHVSEPISVSIPLPANSGLKENDHIPAWRFDPKLASLESKRPVAHPVRKRPLFWEIGAH
ncbi:protein FAM171A1 isoform X1 [Tachysurus ichikawai]